MLGMVRAFFMAALVATAATGHAEARKKNSEVKKAAKAGPQVLIFNPSDSNTIPSMAPAAVPNASEVSTAPILLLTTSSQAKSGGGSSDVEPEDLKMNEQQVMIEDARTAQPGTPTQKAKKKAGQRQNTPKSP